MSAGKVRAWLWAGGVCVLGLAGCVGCSSHSSGDSTGERALAESAVIEGGFASPLDVVIYPEPTAQEAVFAAGQAMVEQCMSDRGFEYVGPRIFFQWRSNDEAQYQYGVTDPKIAARYGFKPPSWVEGATVAREDGTLSDSYTRALYGGEDWRQVKDASGVVIAEYDPSSCSGKALDTVTPGWARQRQLEDLAANIILEADDGTKSDPRVLDATEAWSGCMSAQGYIYDSPDAAHEEFSGDLPTAAEIPVAIASANCFHSSGLLRALSRADAEAAYEALEKYPGLITEWQKLQAEAYERAVAMGSNASTEVAPQ